MNTRAKQGGSALVYGIVSVVLALGVVGAVYAVQKRANGEQAGPMEIASNLTPDEQKPSNDSSADEQKAKNEQERKASEERQAKEEKKAEEQRQAAAEEARKKEAEEKAANEQAARDEAKDKANDEAAPAAGSATPPSQMPSTGGPGQLPQTGPADFLLSGIGLALLVGAILKYSFSHRYVTGR